jgi:hypothetical protein
MLALDRLSEDYRLTDNMDTVKLKKLAEDILARGEKAVEEFDCSPYTEDELNHIMAVIDKQNTKDLEKLLKTFDACDDQENYDP